MPNPGATIEGLSPEIFFVASDDAPVSLDNNTNWIADPDFAHAVYGPDIFTAFLPVYAQKLRALTRLLASFDASNEEYSADPQADVLTGPEARVRLEWGRVSAPQCEAYFERFHASAPAVVRAAAQNMLTKLDQATVRHYLYRPSFGRELDLFSMRCALPNDRELSFYAKAADRLRFEVSRKSAGRYEATGTAAATADSRFLAILSTERRNLLTACQWASVGDLLAEHTVPVPEDLITLVTCVAASCDATGEHFRHVLTSLLFDGGITASANNNALISTLQKAGIIERTTLRRRNNSLPRRYALRGPYLSVFSAVLTTVSGSDHPL